MRLKNLIPTSARLQLKLLARNVHDLVSSEQLAKKRASKQLFAYSFDEKQSIKQTSTSGSKIDNLTVAARLIEEFEIRPQEIFSFWKAVGKPTKGRGFKEGRTIINGELEPSLGGGLCQLSGLIYFTVLQANLEIIERHNHSVDIYTEETRYTPLGSDATVVYGYKDLRIKNNTNSIFKFSFTVTDAQLAMQLKCTDEIELSDVRFVTKAQSDHQVAVATYVDGVERSRSSYLLGKSSQ